MTNQNESSESNKLSAFGKFVELNKLSADYEHWAAATSWTVTETAFLINGICPDKALFDRSMNIGPPNTLYGEGLKLGYAPFLKIEKQLKLLQRAKNDGHLSDRNKPITALSWCFQEGIEVPEECVNAVKAQVDKRAEWQAITEALRQNSEGETEDQADAPEAGEDELTNRNRLIAIFKNMLLDPEVGKHGVFKNQEAIADHIENNFNEKYPNKKLTANGVKEILAAGNKALKDTE